MANSPRQKTRVALAKALINQPELLLLDERTASLDPDTADWIRPHLETIARYGDILLASHNMLEGSDYATASIIIETRPHRGR